MHDLKKFLSSLFILLFHFSCFAAQPNLCQGKQVWGNIEKARLLGKNITLDSKLDTGASMSSLSAQHIELYKQNNITWVKFTVYINHEKINVSEPLAGTIQIRKRKEEIIKNNSQNSQRYVIKIPIQIGNQERTISVNLVDRTHFRYPMLLGKEALQQFNVLIDVSQNYLASEQ